MLDTLEQGIGFHNHPRPSSKRVVVDGVVPVVGEVSNVMKVHLDKSLFLSAGDDAQR